MEEIHVTNTELLIILFLRRPASVQDLAEAFGFQVDSASMHISRMTKKELIVKSIEGYSEGPHGNARTYSLSPLAQSLLKAGYFSDQLLKLKEAGKIVD